MFPVAAGVRQSQAFGINNVGDIVGTYLSGTSNILQGFMLNGSNFIPINDPNAPNGTSPNAISDVREIVGGEPDPAINSQLSFIYFTNNQPAGYQPLYNEATGLPVNATLYGVNKYDHIVGDLDGGGAIFATEFLNAPNPITVPSPSTLGGAAFVVPLFLGLRYLKKKRA